MHCKKGLESLGEADKNTGFQNVELNLNFTNTDCLAEYLCEMPRDLVIGKHLGNQFFQ